MKSKVAVAVSGGIDSLVAASLLKSEGYRVIGLHFLTGYETLSQQRFAADKTDRPEVSTGVSDVSPHPIVDIERQIQAPIHIIDLSNLFEKQVVDYFASTYSSGRTPNPCLVCNPVIKFGELLEKATELGADFLATGHYARIQTDKQGHHLLRGKDLRKDQSYFLAFLNQMQLGRILFPLGEIEKDRVKKIARENGLVPVATEESQDVCFIRGTSYADFLTQKAGFTARSGPIEDSAGNRIGTHTGLHRFTIGQRRGINCPATEPYYVLRIDPANNRLIVGFKNELSRPDCRVENTNWIIKEPSGPVKIHVRLRYRHKAVPAVLTPESSGKAYIRFEKPQDAVTPGQGAVFYLDEEVLGAGWICPI